MATSRTDFMGLDFMVESTYGVANGTDIAKNACVYATEANDYLASTTQKVFARMAAPPSGLPTVPMVEVEHVKQTHNYANKKVKGLQSEGELTFSLHMHGPTHDSPDDYPVPPPWMQMITSAVGAMGGHAAPMGGIATTIAAATDADTFNITAGGVFSGGMIAVDGPGTSTNIEFTRITDVTGSGAVKVFLDCLPALSATPTTDDSVYHTNQVWFDEREESESGTFQNPSFTVLLHRSNQDSAVIFRGFKVTSFKITDTVGEIPTIALTGQYSSYSIEGDGGTEWNEYSGISESMATTASCASAYNYSSIWPEPEVCKDANLAYETGGGARATIETKGFELTWEAGLQKFMSNNAAEGVSALNATGVPKVTFTVTPLYLHSYRAYMGSEIAGLMYSRGGGKGKLFAVHIASGVLQEDPTLDGDVDGNQAQTLTFDAGYYNGDKEGGAVQAYTAGEPTQNRFSIAVA